MTVKYLDLSVIVFIFKTDGTVRCLKLVPKEHLIFVSQSLTCSDQLTCYCDSFKLSKVVEIGK